MAVQWMFTKMETSKRIYCQENTKKKKRCVGVVQNDIYMLMAYEKNKRDIVKGFPKFDLFS